MSQLSGRILIKIMENDNLVYVVPTLHPKSWQMTILHSPLRVEDLLLYATIVAFFFLFIHWCWQYSWGRGRGRGRGRGSHRRVDRIKNNKISSGGWTDMERLAKHDRRLVEEKNPPADQNGSVAHRINTGLQRSQFMMACGHLSIKIRNIKYTRSQSGTKGNRSSSFIILENGGAASVE